MNQNTTKFHNRELYKCLCMDFAFSKENQFNTNSELSWKVFIKNKDFGIECTNFLTNEYVVVDEKKWMLAKINYGF